MTKSLGSALLFLALAGCRGEPARDGGRAEALRLGFFYDGAAREAANQAGKNHWDVYIREILDQMGARGEEVAADILEDEAPLSAFSTLLVGKASLSSRARKNLEAWVRAGGTLVAFATEGLDELCGNRRLEKIAQPVDEFTCAATFELRPHPLTEGIHSELRPDQRLLIFSDVHPVTPSGSVELARLFDLPGRDTGAAAVTARALGAGRAFYFAFGVPQTMWVLHQGRPVDRDHDGDKYLRRSDAIVIRPNPIEVGYADEILFLLQNLIGSRPHAFLYPIPPLRGEVTDALFFYGGDDEGAADGIQLVASNWMKEKGLPYHINAMPRKDGSYGLSAADAAKIRANGHELAIHYNFIDGFKPGDAFTREQLLAQADGFRKQFGADSVCSVNHWVRWTGGVEPARWMLEAGGKADNSFIHSSSPPLDPRNLFGFSFGTAFPFWFYEDPRGGNRRIDFLEEPIVAYECGYTKDAADFPSIRKIVDLAAKYHLTVNMFYHPVYIARYPHCRSAIEELLRYLAERKLRAVHMGPDELCFWWRARTDSRLGPVAVEGNRIRFDVETAHPAGVIVKVPVGARSASSATAGGVPVRFRTERRFGQNWVLAALRPGQSRVEFVLD